MIYSPDWSIRAASRNGEATKAGRLSVFLPFRQGDDDRTLWRKCLCGEVLAGWALFAHDEDFQSCADEGQESRQAPKGTTPHSG